MEADVLFQINQLNKNLLSFKLIFFKLVSELPILGALLLHFFFIILTTVPFKGFLKCTFFDYLGSLPEVFYVVRGEETRRTVMTNE